MDQVDAADEILIIEDDQGCSDLISEVVLDQGYQVRVSVRADEGLQLVQERRPRLVVLDVMLPDGDGFSILQAIREDPATERIPVMLCTAALFEITGFKKPVDDPLTEIVAKPFHIDHFVNVLNRLIAEA
jgi:two-component system alkaline phosphatase synthesis response regulator PhoP